LRLIERVLSRLRRVLPFSAHSTFNRLLVASALTPAVLSPSTLLLDQRRALSFKVCFTDILFDYLFRSITGCT
jgi:hypothetical protein